MAIIYYPSDAKLTSRSAGPNLTEDVISSAPNSIFIFSGSNVVTGSYPSSSYSATASVAITTVNATSASYSAVAINATSASYVPSASISNVSNTASYVSTTFSRGGTLVNSSGITTSGSFIVWTATKNCTVTAVKGYKVGGTSITFNARKNGSSTHLASDATANSDNTWTDGGAVQNTSYINGDKMEISVPSINGAVTQIAVQVNLTT